MSANADQIAYWNEVAGPKWVANQDHLDRLMAPLTEALLAGAAVQNGESIVDIGCGCGDLALRVAERAGADGRVLAVDLSEPMLTHAMSRETASASAARAQIEWCRDDAMTHRFAATADLLVSRFGVMFFEDRSRAFANLRRALKPGARFAMLTWRRRAEVEWMQAPLDWIAPVLPTPEDTTGAVGPFGLADAPSTCSLLAEAGFHDVIAEPVDRKILIGRGVGEATAILCDAGPAAGLLRDAEPSLRREADALLHAAVTRRLVDGVLEMGAACWLYRGRA